MEIDLYELEVGNKFMERTYPEVYKVIEKKKIPEGTEDYDGIDEVIVAKDLESGEIGEWYYNKSIGRAYAPEVVRISRT